VDESQCVSQLDQGALSVMNMLAEVLRVRLIARALVLCALADCGGQATTVLGTPERDSGQSGQSSGGTGNNGASGGAGSSGASGGVAASNGGSAAVDAEAKSRCGFAPDLGSSSAPTPSAAGNVVLTRIFRFLDDTSSVPVNLPQLPNVTADWAGTQARSILDAHVANMTEAPGLVRFLAKWLNVPVVDGGPSPAHTWSIKLLDPSATLTTLLASPTGEPHRIGILTDPQVLVARASISTRGAWMTENLFCQLGPRVPADINQMILPPPPGTTERQWLGQSVNNPVCAGCHSLFDPFGFSLNHFDSLGNYRDTDNGGAVDSSGATRSPMLTFASIDDLAPQLAVSCPVAQCFASLVMNDAFAASGLAILPFTSDEVNHVANAFADSSFSIRELVTAIVETPSFLK
jgi:hypothetical protein